MSHRNDQETNGRLGEQKGNSGVSLHAAAKNSAKRKSRPAKQVCMTRRRTPERKNGYNVKQRKNAKEGGSKKVAKAKTQKKNDANNRTKESARSKRSKSRKSSSRRHKSSSRRSSSRKRKTSKKDEKEEKEEEEEEYYESDSDDSIAWGGEVCRSCSRGTVEQLDPTCTRHDLGLEDVFYSIPEEPTSEF